MAKDPAFLFYTQDFLTGIMFMSNEQVGIYIKLLCAQHQHGGIIDKTAFNMMTDGDKIIQSKFIETDDGFYNERMMIEMEKRKKKSSNLSANALKRWKKEKQKQCKSNAIALQGDMPTEDEDKDLLLKDYIKKIIPTTLNTKELQRTLSAFIIHRQDYGRPINAIPSMEIFLKELNRLSGGKSKIAIQILEHSIRAGYPDIYKPKKEDKQDDRSISEQWDEMLTH